MKLDFLDMRKYLKELRDNVGFKWLALRSAILEKPCLECLKKNPANYDSVYGGCKSCLNIGYAYVDRLIKGYRYFGNPGQDIKLNVGPVNVQVLQYILQHDSNPKPVDWILELEHKEDTMVLQQPIRIVHAYKIESVHDYRGDNGRIEYFRCQVTEQNISIGKSII